jgi:glucose-1-phosphate adenylyltransferase
MALLEDHPELDLYDKEWLIHTKSEERAPARIGQTAQVHRSLISHGCIVDGTVVNSVLSPGVRVEVGAVVRDSIVMFDTVIRRGAIVDRSIIDKEVTIGPGAIIGDGGDDTPNRREPTRLNTGISVVGKRAVIPRSARIGRNVRVAENVRATDFVRKVIPSGGSVDRIEGRGGRPGAPAIAVDERAANAATVARSVEVGGSRHARD